MPLYLYFKHNVNNHQNVVTEKSMQSQYFEILYSLQNIIIVDI